MPVSYKIEKAILFQDGFLVLNMISISNQ